MNREGFRVKEDVESRGGLWRRFLSVVGVEGEGRFWGCKYVYLTAEVDDLGSVILRVNSDCVLD